MRPILADGELSASIRRAIRGGLSIMGSDRKRSGGESPGERLAATQRLQLGVAEGQRLRQGPGELLQRHRRLVRRHAIEGRAGTARELLEAVERAGCYTAFSALELYAEAFEAAGALDRLEQFASRAGPAFYGMAPNKTTVTLRKLAWTLPEALPFGDAEVKPLRGGETLAWRLAA